MCSHIISGTKTNKDWAKFRESLNSNNANCILWKKVVSDYFYPRINIRYLQPIEAIRKSGQENGEGFAIMVILCSLIEFLEATYQGKVYRFGVKEKDLKPVEYSRSKAIFINFLTNRAPFSEQFNNQTAKSFYEDIRCGLLHEASTKDEWLIKADSGSQNKIFFDDVKKYIYRNQFETAIRDFITSYCTQLITDENLQKNFIVKWDNL